jgi:hypothetical protein
LRNSNYSWGGIALVVVAIAVLIWQPWNANQRMASQASDSYYTAETTFTDCTPHQSTQAIIGCWQSFASSIQGINWPPVLITQEEGLVNDINQVITTLQTGSGYDSALVKWGDDKTSFESSLDALANTK